MIWGPDMTQGAVVRFKRTRKEAILPAKAHSGDAGFDLFAAEAAYIRPGRTYLVSIGFDVALPMGYVGFVCSRSGLAAKDEVFVLNAPGVVDSGYRGPLKVILRNAGSASFYVDKGDRIGQLVVQKTYPVAAVEVAEFEDDTERGTGGFGSSGK